MLIKPNLLIAGASGGVANALLHHLVSYRDLFGTLVLVDKSDKVLSDEYIDHKRLQYTFIQTELSFTTGKAEYQALLRKHKVHIVIDITDMDSVPFWRATDDVGVSYINTGMNADDKSIQDLVISAFEKRNECRRAAHILCSGMNPGNVNMWVQHGIEQHGVPQQIIHFEYDTSKVAKQWHPMMTWSIHEFITECVKDPGGVIKGRGASKVEELLPNALTHRKNMRDVLEPIMKLPSYPEGMLVLHEECASLAQKYDIPSQFLYAINPQTTEALIKLYKKKGTVSAEDLILGDNTNEILDGADSIGVLLKYTDKKVYYFNTIPSVAVIGTNATYTQVVIEIFSALCVLLFDSVEPGTYFPEDLYHSRYRYFMFDNMRVQEFVFKKHSDGHLSPLSYTPMIKIRRPQGYERLYII